MTLETRTVTIILRKDTQTYGPRYTVFNHRNPRNPHDMVQFNDKESLASDLVVAFLNVLKRN